MTLSLRKIPWPAKSDPDQVLSLEWLVTNGRGGYASGTVAGIETRRYHGLLVSALPAPHGRILMLKRLVEHVKLADGTLVPLGGEELTGTDPVLHDREILTEFRLEDGLPVWRYEFAGLVLERRVLMPHMQNTVFVIYHLLRAGGPVRMRLAPGVNFRGHEDAVDTPLLAPYQVQSDGDRYEIAPGNGLPALKLKVWGQAHTFTMSPEETVNSCFREERSRGYGCSGRSWMPGYLKVVVEPGETATLAASTENWETMLALTPTQAIAAENYRRSRMLSLAGAGARRGLGAELVMAADQLIITPAGRIADAARAHASGDEERTVIAGYHWFTDWGRDTMISLEGLTLSTGRHLEAGWILRTFYHHLRDGLIPNMFPEGGREALYNTADATLWFFHAVSRYLKHTDDRETLRLLLPGLLDVINHHWRGTRFSIGVDPSDGLLRQGAEGFQLTWMDAKVDGWVVTPRRGKTVEINALWYNALKLLERWAREEMGDAVAQPLAEHAEQVRASFNRRFWYEEGGYLYDLVDGEGGDDSACRPNQVLAISLSYPVLDRERWEPVMETVRRELLTPVGLRSLAPGHPDYKSKYFGDLRARDAAYHQGTVWAWLIGPFIDAWLKLHPDDRAGARRFLDGFQDHLSEGGIGTISEIFDAELPFIPRGCVAQAWSVAEVLRAWVKTAG